MKTLRTLAALALFATIALTPLHAQDWAKAALDKSPRHREWVTIKSGSRNLQAFVVYPEVSTKAPVVVLIHEIFGLSDWARLQADEIAALGYIVIAPDLLSGMGPKDASGQPGGTAEIVASGGDATKFVSQLDPTQVTADLDAAADYGKHLPAASNKLASVGFCWGGGKSFAFATHRHDLAAAFVFYGPPPADVTTITAPVYAFYAGNDMRIGATIPDATAAMKAAGKIYQPVTYDGAGHGFMRAGQQPDATPANQKAFNDAFIRLTALLKTM
jgi:carboxymethylenebutenolidase